MKFILLHVGRGRGEVFGARPDAARSRHILELLGGLRVLGQELCGQSRQGIPRSFFFFFKSSVRAHLLHKAALLGPEDLGVVRDKISETISWINGNKSASKEEFDDRFVASHYFLLVTNPTHSYKDFERVVNPLLVKMGGDGQTGYSNQADGMAGMAEGFASDAPNDAPDFTKSTPFAADSGFAGGAQASGVTTLDDDDDMPEVR